MDFFMVGFLLEQHIGDWNIGNRCPIVAIVSMLWELCCSLVPINWITGPKIVKNSFIIGSIGIRYQGSANRFNAENSVVATTLGFDSTCTISQTTHMHKMI